MLTLKKWLICLLLIFAVKLSHSQINTSDSLFLKSISANNLFINETAFPGNWYVYDSLNSLASLYTRIDSIFKFTTQDFYGSFDNIELTTSAYYDSVRNISFNNYYNLYSSAYYQTNPLQQLNFTLENKQATSFFTYTPSTAPSNNFDIAFFIIPGSHYNQTTQIIKGQGYHNTSCFVKNSLKQYGDVYIQCKPLQDYRALRWQGKKIKVEDYNAPDYIYSYLTSQGKPYGINYLIESIATIKYLKSKYKKVVLLGCSQGGYASLLTSLEAHADGYIISSGFSINFNNSPAQLAPLVQLFGSVINTITDTFIKAHLQNDKALYYFSWPNFESPIYQGEHDYHYSENYFNNYNNVSYFYDYNYHSFPPCHALDTFIQKVITKPTSALSILNFNCNPFSAVLKASFYGTPPYTFDLYHNDTLAMQMNAISDSIVFNVSTSGIYQIKNLVDANNNVGFNSDTVVIDYESYLNIAFQSKFYHCDSNKYKFDYELKGHQPFKISFTENGQQKVIDSIKANNISLFLSEGLTVLNSIENNNGCVKTINDSLVVNAIADASSLFDIIKYDCDSNYTIYKIKNEFPYLSKIVYYKNGLLDSSQIINSTFYLKNGNYQFNKLVFNNGCAKNINISQSLNNNLPTASNFVSKYECDSSKNKLTFDLTGNSPWSIFYTSQDTFSNFLVTDSSKVKLYINNGNTTISSITDSNGCKIGPVFFRNYNDSNATFSLVNKVYNCDSNKMQFIVKLEGKSPWKLYYSRNSLLDSVILINPISNIFLQNGNYHFEKIIDANSCQFMIHQNYLLNEQAVNYQHVNTQYNCATDSTQITSFLYGKSPFTIKYTKNGQLESILESSPSTTWNFANGNYVLSTLTDSNGCVFHINDFYQFNYQTLNASVGTPIYNCDSNKAAIQFAFQGNAPFTIIYTKNNGPDSFTTSQNSIVKYFDNGNYIFQQVKDATACIQSINTNANHTINFNTLSLLNSVPVYDCNLQQSKIDFTFTGNAPYTVHYTKGGVPHTFISHTDTTARYFTNGTYNLLHLVDATNCIKNIHHLFTINTQPISVVLNTPAFNCDSNKTEFTFLVQANLPAKLFFTNNGQADSLNLTQQTNTIYLGVGNYVFGKIRDITNCEAVINYPYQVTDTALTYSNAAVHYNCNTNLTDLSFHLGGKAPYQISYTKNSVMQSLSTTSHSVLLPLADGVYNIFSIEDANGCKIYPISQTYNIHNTSLSYQLNSNDFDCNNNVYNLDILATGNFPITLHYIKNGIVDSAISNVPNFSLQLQQGTAIILHLTDVQGCLYNINQNLVLQDSSADITYDSIRYDCALNKNYLPIRCYGPPPYLLKYQENGIQHSKIISTSADTIYFGNGVLLLENISNASNCSRQINKSFTLNVPSIALHNLQTKYNCHTRATDLSINLSGVAPFTLKYLGNGSVQQMILPTSSEVLSLQNGNYKILNIADANTCLINLDTSLFIHETPLAYTSSIGSIDCETQETEITYTLQGKPGFELIIGHQNQLLTYRTTDTIFKKHLTSGNLFTYQITDANNCKIYPADTVWLNMDADEKIELTYDNYMLSISNNSARSYKWYLNGKLIDSSTNSVMHYKGNGAYHAEVMLQNGCWYPSNTKIIEEQAFLVFPNPVKQNFTLIYNLPLKTFTTTACLYDAFGKMVNKFLVAKGNNNFSIEHLAAGIYYLQVPADDDLIKFENVKIIKIP